MTRTLGGVTTSYTYGAGNDLLTKISMGGVTTQTIGYTDDSRMATLDPGIESPGSQLITSLTYDQDAKLSAVNAGSAALGTYTYDGFGQRLLKTISGTSGNIYQYGQNGLLLEETDQAGTAQADYIYLNGRPIADLDPSSGTLYYLHDDLLGTPQLASRSCIGEIHRVNGNQRRFDFCRSSATKHRTRSTPGSAIRPWPPLVPELEQIALTKCNLASLTLKSKNSLKIG